MGWALGGSGGGAEVATLMVFVGRVRLGLSFNVAGVLFCAACARAAAPNSSSSSAWNSANCIMFLEKIIMLSILDMTLNNNENLHEVSN